MSKLKLTYFDFHGGRGEVARLALNIGGVEFEDYRFPFSEFADVKATTPLGQVPTLTIDGGPQITQSNGINRYVGKLANLYPADDLQALVCDEVMDAIEDATAKIVATFPLQGDEQKTARETLAAGPLTHYLKWAEARLEAQGGEFYADNRLTVADLKAFVWIGFLNSGKLDHFPTDLVERVAPKLNVYAQRIAQTPAIVKYYA
jgi:glutathione S-transferase